MLSETEKTGREGEATQETGDEKDSGNERVKKDDTKAAQAGAEGVFEESHAEDKDGGAEHREQKIKDAKDDFSQAVLDYTRLTSWHPTDLKNSDFVVPVLTEDFEKAVADAHGRLEKYKTLLKDLGFDQSELYHIEKDVETDYFEKKAHREVDAKENKINLHWFLESNKILEKLYEQMKTGEVTDTLIGRFDESLRYSKKYERDLTGKELSVDQDQKMVDGIRHRDNIIQLVRELNETKGREYRKKSSLDDFKNAFRIQQSYVQQGARPGIYNDNMYVPKDVSTAVDEAKKYALRLGIDEKVLDQVMTEIIYEVKDKEIQKTFMRNYVREMESEKKDIEAYKERGERRNSHGNWRADEAYSGAIRAGATQEQMNKLRDQVNRGERVDI